MAAVSRAFGRPLDLSDPAAVRAVSETSSTRRRHVIPESGPTTGRRAELSLRHGDRAVQRGGRRAELSLRHGDRAVQRGGRRAGESRPLPELADSPGSRFACQSIQADRKAGSMQTLMLLTTVKPPSVNKHS